MRLLCFFDSEIRDPGEEGCEIAFAGGEVAGGIFAVFHQPDGLAALDACDAQRERAVQWESYNSAIFACEGAGKVVCVEKLAKLSEYERHFGLCQVRLGNVFYVGLCLEGFSILSLLCDEDCKVIHL